MNISCGEVLTKTRIIQDRQFPTVQIQIPTICGIF